MKTFTVEPGTLGRVVHVGTNRDTEHRTCKRCVFTDTVTDPVAYHNGRRSDYDWANNYAAAGKAVFQSENAPQWFLIVPYRHVRVN